MNRKQVLRARFVTPRSVILESVKSQSLKGLTIEPTDNEGTTMIYGSPQTIMFLIGGIAAQGEDGLVYVVGF